MSLPTLLLSPATQSFLAAEKPVKMTRPILEPIAVVSPRDLNISISRDRSPSAPFATDSDTLACTSSPKFTPSEPSPHPLPKCVPSPSRRRQPSRRQSSISYLPADSPRLWTPRTPLTGSDILEHSPSLSGNNGKKERHTRTLSTPHRVPSEPAVLTLAERHADLLQIIAQKESECLEFRSQLAVHESELLDLKRKWERIVHREFGRNVPPLTSSTTSAQSAALALANTSSAVMLNGLVGGVRALAAATTTPSPVTSSSTTRSRTLSSSSAFAKRVTRQAASASLSSTTTSSSSSAPSADGSPRLSQSSMSSVAEEKTDLKDVEDRREEKVLAVISRRDKDPTLASAPSSSAERTAIVAQQPRQQRSPTFLEQRLPSPSNKDTKIRRGSRDLRDPLADAPRKSPTGEEGTLSFSGSGKRASISGGVVAPTSAPISGINPLGAMGLGRANLGEAAQGWVDTVGSKLAELQRGQTFSKSQKRASVLLSDVSQSIFSAFAPGSTANLAPASVPSTQSLIDEDDDAGSTALGSALLPDVVAASPRTSPSLLLPTSTSTPESKDDDEDWNW